MTNPSKDITWSDKFYFGGNREKTILRDGEKCVKCGITRTEHKIKHKRDLAVDHINGKGAFDRKSEVPNNNLDNLQTLCLPCHTKKDLIKNRTLMIFHEYCKYGHRMVISNFYINPKKLIFCKICRSIAQKNRSYAKQCEWCHKDYQAKEKAQRFCSNSCSMKWQFSVGIKSKEDKSLKAANLSKMTVCSSCNGNGCHKCNGKGSVMARDSRGRYINPVAQLTNPQKGGQ